MKIYEKMYSDWSNSPTPERTLADYIGTIEQRQWETTHGYRILQRAGRNRDVDALFGAFVDYGRAQGDWIWDPGIPGFHRGKLLDGTQGSGECALFAANFWVLCWAPEPYGLGIGKDNLELWDYRGRHGRGFVAKHNHPGIVSDLRANVRQYDQVEAPTELYLWDNHKVVVHNNTMYDVAYGVTGPRPRELGAYQIKEAPRPGTEDIDGPLFRNDFMAHEVSLEGATYLVASDVLFDTVLFRKVPAEIRPDRPYQGPFEIDGNTREIVPAPVR